MTEPTAVSYRFDPDDLTLDEVDDLEEATGKSMGEVTLQWAGCAICGRPHTRQDCDKCGRVHQPPKIGAKGKPVAGIKYDHEWQSPYDHDRVPPLRGKTIAAIAWIMERRNNPEFTMADAGKITVRQVFEGQDANGPKEIAASTGT